MIERQDIVKTIAEEIGLTPTQVQAAIRLLEDGNAVPFIARYRKEATGGLDEWALRSVQDAWEKAIALSERKAAILKSLAQGGHLNDELQAQVQQALDLQRLEAIYLPYRPKRRTRGSIARELGLEPLAKRLLSQEPLGTSRQAFLQAYVDPAKGVPDPETALQGALDIVAEHWADDLDARDWLQQQALNYGRINARLKRGQTDPEKKYLTYHDHQEPVRKIPSHRFLAIWRGQSEGVLKVTIEIDQQRAATEGRRRWIHHPRFEFHAELLRTLDDCLTRLLLPATESAILQLLKDRADQEAIDVFGKNLRELLMAPPAGQRVTMGIDPGFRTGCKIAVIDSTGKFLTHTTIYPTPPKNDSQSAAKVLCDLVDRYQIELIAIGNGTASRETDRFITDLIRQQQWKLTKVVVSEAGASVYSASEIAAREFPDLDLTVRGAISIARRLQDPLAELVKSDPKTIGVGQYQHDVHQGQLKKCLDRVVESCVNQVGVDLNTASTALLAYVAGIGPKLAERIVEFRDTHGRFDSRKTLLSVPKLGKKAFEQAAGFLRIRGGSEPLDASAVHPESYAVVGRMARKAGCSPAALLGEPERLGSLRPEEFVSDAVGLPTVHDILQELGRPGRDPRNEFQVAQFSESVQSMKDLNTGMVLEGVITNVTHFGAFVDIGVHQDALIHVSQLSNEFVHDPNQCVAVGDIVQVKILDVDLERKRIAASRKF